MVLRPAAWASVAASLMVVKKRRKAQGREKERGKRKVRKARKEEIFTFAGKFYVPDVMGY